MLTSIRHMVECTDIGSGPSDKAPGDISLLKHFFGYTSAPKSSPGVVDVVSVRQQLSLLRHGHVHLNFVYVGLDSASSASQDAKLDAAIALARRAFRQVGIGIGRIRRARIAAADALGYDDLESGAEAAALRRTFTYSAGGVVHIVAGLPAPVIVPDYEENDALDVFIVRRLFDDEKQEEVGGSSPLDGGCDTGPFKSAAIIVYQPVHLGLTLAHELGHFLGLAHAVPIPGSPTNNIMQQYGKSPDATFTATQGEKLRDHCMLRPPCI